MALALPTCALAAAAHRGPEVNLPAAYEALAPGAAVLAPQSLDQWWRLFNDPALDALEDQAFAAGPDARIIAQRVLEARAVRNSQVAQTLPTGNVTGKATRQHSSNIGAPVASLFPVGGDTETETANFNVSWEIDLFGRLAQARKVAKASLAQARFNIEGSRASLAASVADNYFLAKGFAIQIADANETVRIRQGLRTLAQRKATIGLAAQSDVDRVDGDLAQARAQVEDLRAQLTAAQRQLLILVGQGAASTAAMPVVALVADPPAAPGAVPGDLLARRPDVREAESRLRAEIGTARLRHLAIFPTFTLLPGLGLSRTVQPGVAFTPPAKLTPDTQTTSLGFWSLAAGVTVPLLDIPRLLYDAKAEDARSAQAAIAYEKTVQTAYAEAENALANLAAGKRAVALLSDGETRAKRASDAAHTRYAMGFDVLTAALTAEQAWRTTRAALTTERVQALRRAVQTYKALGGGWAFAGLSTPQRPPLTP